jgi:hypothetical protein
MATTRKSARKVSDAERARRAEAARAKLESAHETLEAGVAALVNGEEWASYLAAAAHFPRYSMRNILLIAKQRSDATRVAGYTAWQKLGYQVRKGEVGIVILAPAKRRISEEEARQQDKPELAGTFAIYGWTTVSVFDVSQTDPIEGRAQPLDEPPIRLVEGAAPEGLQEELERQIVAAGFAFFRGVPPTPGANGTTSWADRRVVVRADVDDAQAAKTTAHELAHILLGHEHATDPRSRQEIEAESVAYVVSAANGLDASAYTFGYVVTWAGPNDAAEEVRETAVRVLAVARQILNAQPAAEDERDAAELASA